MKLSRIVDDCLARMAAGESIEECLARYPQKAAELAPLLTTAARLRGLADVRLSQGQRLRAKVALREALAERSQPATPLVRRWPRLLPVVSALVAVLFVVVVGGAITVSRAGDIAYPLRVTIERAPALVRFSSAGRAAEEASIAGRRLADVREYLLREGTVQPVALAELLARDRAALHWANQLGAEARLSILATVMGHAEELASLASVAADDEAQASLQAAAEQLRAMLARFIPAPAQESTPQPRPASPTPSATAAPPNTAAAVAPTRTPVPTRTAARAEAPPLPAASRPTYTPTLCPTLDVGPAATPSILLTDTDAVASPAEIGSPSKPTAAPVVAPTSPPTNEPTALPPPSAPPPTPTFGPKLTLAATDLPPEEQPATVVAPPTAPRTIAAPTVYATPDAPATPTPRATVTPPDVAGVSSSGLATPPPTS